jgi:D-lactate dehydrogenase (cytochrome)
LHGRPEAVAVATCHFTSIEAAVRTVITTIQLGIPVARIELLDDVQMGAINRFSKLSYPEFPTLFFEFHGLTERDVTEQADAVGEIAAEHGAQAFERAVSLEARTALWQARHDAYYAALAMRPGSRGWTTDACVPISRLADCILETKRDLEGSHLVASLVGHAGDGNFHLIVPVNPDDPRDIEEAERLSARLAERAIAMGGTCTGEHGVGLGKMKYLEREHGEAMDVMRAIKRTLDPDNIMNPGKLL